jgi:hypothetical protein
MRFPYDNTVSDTSHAEVQQNNLHLLRNGVALCRKHLLAGRLNAQMKQAGHIPSHPERHCNSDRTVQGLLVEWE